MQNYAKHNNRSTVVVTLLLSVIFSIFSLSGCSSYYASNYTEEEHIRRVTDLARKRYITEFEPFTDLSVYPLYDVDDKLAYFVIELEPYGYVYVKIIPDSKLMHFERGMYIRNTDTNNIDSWSRYKIALVPTSVISDTGEVAHRIEEQYTEFDDNGAPVEYLDSHYKVAGISDEKRYLIECRARYDGDIYHGYIPAVKRDNKYINLVNMEEFEYKQELDILDLVTASHVDFIRYSYFKL